MLRAAPCPLLEVASRLLPLRVWSATPGLPPHRPPLQAGASLCCAALLDAAGWGIHLACAAPRRCRQLLRCFGVRSGRWGQRGPPAPAGGGAAGAGARQLPGTSPLDARRSLFAWRRGSGQSCRALACASSRGARSRPLHSLAYLPFCRRICVCNGTAVRSARRSLPPPRRSTSSARRRRRRCAPPARCACAVPTWRPPRSCWVLWTAWRRRAVHTRPWSAVQAGLSWRSALALP